MEFDLSKIREQLIIERDRLLDDVNNLDVAKLSTPDDRQTSVEDAQLLGEGVDVDTQVTDMKHARLEKIEAALQNIGKGDYGTCRRCGKEIDPRRLEAEPTALTCVACQAREEQGFEAPTM